MKKFLLVFGMMVIAMMSYAQGTKRVAILEVVDREGKLTYSQKLVLRSNMARAVANTFGYEAYDRSDVDVIMSEHEFQRTGLVSDADIRKLGEMTGVSLILVTEGVLMGDKIFVSAKILNVETGKVEIMDNITVGLDPLEMQQGCMQLAQRLFGVTSESSAIDKYNIERMGPNQYIYMGKYMEKKEYEYFLRNNCPKAYGQYKTGKQLIGAGWGVIGGGLVLLAIGAGTIDTRGVNHNWRDGGAIAFTAIGASVPFVAGIPLLSVGYVKRNRAYKVYNSNCASSSASTISLNIVTDQNGFGLAVQF